MAEDTKAPPPEAAAAPKPGPLRILLAEDQELNAKIIAFFLRQEGHDVQVVGNGRKALDKLAAETFDLVLMDVQMPVLDGLAALRRIRSGEIEGVDPEVPVFALTAHAGAGEREQLLSAGMDDYLTKPLDTDKLHAAIAGLMRRKSGSAQERRRPAGGPDEGVRIDFAGLVRKFSGDAKIVGELLLLYIETADQKGGDIFAAAKGGDLARLAEDSHALAGIAASFGLTTVAEACKTIQDLALNGDAKALPGAIGALAVAMDKTNAAIRGHVGQAPDGTPAP